MNELATQYDPQAVEEGLDKTWEEAGFYKPEIPSEKPSFCICIPPPNVTGALHMGHALTFTIQDILTRWKRMDGYNALWLPGTDHAGIATQMVVERELRKDGLSRFDLGREKFLERTFEWKEEYRDRIVNQMRHLGGSVDWSRERFTLDEGYCKAVRKVFVDLYKEGLIYRDHRLVNWSPGIHTVLSDLEIDHKEVDGHLWHLEYPLADGSGRSLVVATTRPETMLGDTAVAVHPDDERHSALIGKTVRLPLVDREIPIIADAELVDLEFGTGAVKITPAHDPNDFETGKRHDLESINIFDKDACLNENVPAAFQGMSREEARKSVVAQFDALGLLVKVEDHKHAVGHCQRTGTIVEPMLSTQWFVRIKPLADPAIAAVREGRIKFVPETWTKTYYNWMENIRDWCISRQLWWGHRIPVWTCADCGAEICEMEDPDRCTSCNGVNLEQDIDVLDTWFSSGLWPFATMGWPDETEDLNRFYPNTVMETGFDIIFFWVARMIMMGHKFMGEAPFQTVYLHAMVRDEKGEKMSKTKGNVIDPLEVIKDHGADPLRFTLAMMAGQGRDIKLSLQRVAGYRAFCNKLWNATRFVLMNVEDMDAQAFERGRAGAVGMQERWILSKLQQTVDDCDQALQEYRFNDAASSIYQFSWHTFCDWYVELSKHALKDESDSAKREATQATLLRCLEGVLRLLHPMMPHMTERLWQALPQFARSDAKMLIVAPWPKNEQFSDDDGVIEGLQDHVNDVVSAIRNLRSERQIAPKIRLQVQMYSNRTELVSALQENKEQVSALCRLESLTVAQGEPQDLKDGASLLLVGDTQVVLFVPVDEAGLKEERARLEKQIAKVEENLAHIDRKLNNPSFVDRAPEAVVAKERERRAQAQEELEKYQERLNQIG